MASLQEQLQQLQFAEPRPASGDKVVSLLYTQEHAATLDTEEIRSIAASGLDQLALVSKDIGQHERLFAVSSRDISRRNLSGEQAASIDSQIKAFLRDLSPMYQLPAAHMTIEWLIRQYHVHEDNVHDVIQCILPYYTTKIFVRTVQILRIRKLKELKWLMPVAKQGIPMTRAALVKYAKSDRGVLKYVCKTVHNAVKGLKNQKLAGHYTTMYASVLTGILADATSVSEDTLMVLMPFLLSGIKSKRRELQAASYIVVSQLCASKSLSDTLLVSLFSAVCGHMRDGMVADGIKCKFWNLQCIFPSGALQHCPCLRGLLWSVFRSIHTK